MFNLKKGLRVDLSGKMSLVQTPVPKKMHIHGVLRDVWVCTIIVYYLNNIKPNQQTFIIFYDENIQNSFSTFVFEMYSTLWLSLVTRTSYS